MSEDDDADEETTFLLTTPSKSILDQGKKNLLETVQVGQEILSSLKGDMEKIERITNTNKKAKLNMKLATDNLRAIEKYKLKENCLFFLVIICVISVLIYVILLIFRQGK